MKRREFITLLGGAATWPVVAHAQRAYRIGVLDTTSTALSGDQPRAARFARKFLTPGISLLNRALRYLLAPLLPAFRQSLACILSGAHFTGSL
jgi:hypothetical protein